MSSSSEKGISFYLKQSPSSLRQKKKRQSNRGTAALGISGPVAYYSLPLGDLGSFAGVMGGAGLFLSGLNELYQENNSPDFTKVEDPDFQSIKTLLEDEPELMMGSTEINTHFSIPSPYSTRDLKSYSPVEPRKAKAKFQNSLDNTARYDRPAQTVDVFTVDDVDIGWELWIEEKDMEDELVGSTAYRGATDHSVLLGYDDNRMSFDEAIDQSYDANL